MASAAVVLSLASTSRAEEPASVAVAPAPRLHHEPVAIAPPGVSLAIQATIDHPQLIKHALLVYRPTGATALKEVPFLRSAGGFIATIPETDIAIGTVGYAIEFELPDGKRLPMYASREDLHIVAVPDQPDDALERAYLGKVDGRRVVFGGSFEYVSFGTSAAARDKTVKLPDWYLRSDLSFTYRPLRSVMEFGLRLGLVRGRSTVAGQLVPSFAGATTTGGCEKADDPACKVGLNYGAPFVTFRVSDGFFWEVDTLVSVTEVGFSTGIGTALHIGDFYGTKFVFGAETIKTFGSRAYARLDLLRGRVRVSPIVEVTDMPHADTAGVRLLAELGLDLGSGVGLTLRGGYQARNFDSGSGSLGGTFAYAF